MDHVIETLRCPICTELPANEIYQCKNGHVICKQCCQKLTQCPQCKLPFETERIRNRVVEELLRHIEVKCFNGGCQMRGNQKEMKAHKISCQLRDINFCRLLGFRHCHFCHSQPSVIFQHLAATHEVQKFGTGSSSEIITIKKNFKTYANSTKSKSRVIIWSAKFEGDSEPAMFARKNSVNCQNQNDLAFTFFHLNNSAEQASKYWIELEIEDPTTKTVKWKWIGEPICFKRANEDVTSNNAQFRIPLGFLTEHVGKREDFDLRMIMRTGLKKSMKFSKPNV